MVTMSSTRASWRDSLRHIGACSHDNSGVINVIDAIAGLEYLFGGGPPPGACGRDPDSPDARGDLGCAEYSGCQR